MKYDFAKRMEKLTPSLILEISAQASADPEVINLSAGQPDLPTPDSIKKAGIAAINDNFTRYTAGSGIPELRKAVADKVSRETGIERIPEEIVISNGAKHSLSNTILALVDVGDRVLLPAPYWISYPEMVFLAQGEVIQLPTYLNNGFRLTPAQLEATLSTDPKLIILNSPSNPTGAAYSKKQYDILVPMLKESGVMVISDEIYSKLLFDDQDHISLASYPEIRDQLILINGVSKTFSMTGWRIGWAVANPEVAKKIGNIQSQMTSSPCSISQKASLEAVNRPEDEFLPVLETFQKRRNRIVELVAEIPDVEFHPPEGAFYIFIDISAYLPALDPAEKSPTRSLDLAKYLVREHKVAIVPGMVFGDDDHIRISFAASLEDIEEGITRLKKGMMDYRKVGH
jgi:aspartate aminotransferase